jgi:hypothetical protein
MDLRLTVKRFGRSTRACAVTLCAAAAWLVAAPAYAGWCDQGLWADAMVGSYHINPDPSKHLEQFNPGIGAECYFTSEWAATAGYFRNSLSRPSFYGGAVWAPEFVHWGWFRVAAMGGLISGYNYGRWGIGHNRSVGPVLAPVLMTNFGRVGANFILIPPIPSEKLPFTIGFQLKIRLN